MKLKALKSNVTSKIGRQILVAQKNSPVLMFGVGVVGVVATAVMASKATLQMDEVLREAQIEKDRAIEALEADPDTSDDMVKKTGVAIRVNTALRIAKIYAPAVVLGVVSIGCLTGSHVLLSKRNASLTAAYAALDKGFKEYRGRVVEKYGADEDLRMRFGSEMVEIAVDTDEGPVVKTVERLNGVDKGSIYAVMFSKSTSRHWSDQYGENRDMLKIREAYLNTLLQSVGYVLLNEVYDALGMQPTSAGCVVGWVKGNGDDYIDLGVLTDIDNGRAFIRGDVNDVLVDPNVDGVVYDLIDKASKKG